MISIKYKRIHPDAKIPSYAHEGDAGMDLYSVEDYVLKPGIATEMPEGYFGSIRDRSGLAARYAIHVLAGVIDCHYRGEIGVVIINLGKEEFSISKGDRIAQVLIQTVEHVNILEVNELSETSRGKDGFGSTGIN